MELELQSYLKNKGLESLQEEFKIKVNRDREFENLVCLKYSQIESPLEYKIVQQCRGIILDEAQNWNVVSYPYDKFFNYGENNAASINWDSAKVYEKLDGSLMTIYCYRGQWRVQSSGTTDGSGQVNISKYTFKSLFWKVWQQLNYQLPLNKDYCFMFEMMTPYNRIVVRHENNKLVLHGVRNIKTFQEENPELWSNKYSWEVVKTYPFKDLETIIEASNILDPMEMEGYIVCDRIFNRIKIKSTDYIRISHMREGISTRKLLNIVVTNEGEEVLAYFPEYQEFYQEIKNKYDLLVAEIDKTYQQYKDIPVQKDFALAIKSFPYSGTLFSLRSGKVATIKESLKNTTITKLESLLELDYLSLISPERSNSLSIEERSTKINTL